MSSLLIKWLLHRAGFCSLAGLSCMVSAWSEKVSYKKEKKSWLRQITTLYRLFVLSLHLVRIKRSRAEIISVKQVNACIHYVWKCSGLCVRCKGGLVLPNLWANSINKKSDKRLIWETLSDAAYPQLAYKAQKDSFMHTNIYSASTAATREPAK